MAHNIYDLPSNRKFGFFFAAVFFISAIYFFYQDKEAVFLILGSIGLLFFIITIVKDSLLLPLNKLWMRFGIILGMIVSPIVLAIIFFIMFTPIAIGMRIFQRDELRLRSQNTESYWKTRNQVNFDLTSFKQQF
jgi:hypothetical protein